jgi:hypothetical protein
VGCKSCLASARGDSVALETPKRRRRLAGTGTAGFVHIQSLTRKGKAGSKLMVGGQNHHLTR